MRRQRPHGGEPYRCGPWVQERIMGKGAFGSVTLWHNERTDEKVCIKECHSMDLSERLRLQWERECKIMLSLRHPNVVRGLPTPPELDNGSARIPVLAVEYCQGGDLRKVLTRADNSCGLPEVQVRAITRDISLAIEYLHSKKIVHRDLKPENIVLKRLSANKFQYKLIDLGYAKDISAGSICKSFVGTEQYLAPELFTSGSMVGGHYNNNVDFWCLGTTVFECIVGWRPFFHGIPALQWLKNVSEKKPDQIVGIINLENDVVFSKSIPGPHRLCRYSTHQFEQWLRLMLRYNPNTRGGGMTTENRPACFAMLENMLKTNILHVYSVSTNRVLSCPVDQETLGDVLQMIHQDLSKQQQAMEFYSVNGVLLTEDKLALRCCAPQDEEGLVFLIPESSLQAGIQKRAQPELVQFLLSSQGSAAQIPFDLLKRVYSHFLYYVMESNRDYHHLSQAHRSLNICLMRRKRDLTNQSHKVSLLLQDLKSKMDFFNESIQIDLERLEHLKSSGIYSNKMANFWSRTKDQVSKYVQLEHEVIQMVKQCETVENAVMDMTKVPRGRNEDFGAAWEKKLTTLYENLRKTPKENRTNQMDNSEIIKYTTEYITECVHQMGELHRQIQEVLDHKQHIGSVLPQLVQLQHRLLEAKDKISTFQRQRQTDIWGLFHELTKSVDIPNRGMPPPNHAGITQRLSPTGMGDPVAMVTSSVAMATTPSLTPSMTCNSSLMIEKSHEESMTLRSENLSGIQRIQETVSNLENFANNTPRHPDWSFLDQEDSIQMQE